MVNKIIIVSELQSNLMEARLRKLQPTAKTPTIGECSIAQAIGDRFSFVPLDRTHDMRVMPDHRVGLAIDNCVSKVAMRRLWVALELVIPVRNDDDACTRIRDSDRTNGTEDMPSLQRIDARLGPSGLAPHHTPAETQQHVRLRL